MATTLTPADYRFWSKIVEDDESTFTLLTPTDCNSQTNYRIIQRDLNAGRITLVPEAGNTIMGGANYFIDTSQNGAILFYVEADKNWEVLLISGGSSTQFDNAEPWVANRTYATGEIFNFSTTNTTAKDIDGKPIIANTTYFGKYRLGKTSTATLTNAEMAFIELVAPPSGSDAIYLDKITETTIGGKMNVFQLKDSLGADINIANHVKPPVYKGGSYSVDQSNGTEIVSRLIYVANADGDGWEPISDTQAALASLHDGGETAAVAVPDTPGVQAHLEGGEGYDLDGAKFSDNFWMILANTTNAAQETPFKGFTQVRLQNGEPIAPLTSPITVPANTSYFVHVVQNGTNKYMNLSPMSAGSVQEQENIEFTNAATIDIPARALARNERVQVFSPIGSDALKVKFDNTLTKTVTVINGTPTVAADVVTIPNVKSAIIYQDFANAASTSGTTRIIVTEAHVLPILVGLDAPFAIETLTKSATIQIVAAEEALTWDVANAPNGISHLIENIGGDDHVINFSGQASIQMLDGTASNMIVGNDLTVRAGEAFLLQFTTVIAGTRRVYVLPYHNTSGIDAAQAWVRNNDYTNEQNFNLITALTDAVDINGNAIIPNQMYLMRYRVGKVSQDATAPDATEIALMEQVNEQTSPIIYYTTGTPPAPRVRTMPSMAFNRTSETFTHYWNTTLTTPAWEPITQTVALSFQAGRHAFNNTGSGTSNLFYVAFPTAFANAPLVHLQYEWNYNASTNGATNAPTIEIESITATGFSYRIVGNRNTLDRVLWQAVDPLTTVSARTDIEAFTPRTISGAGFTTITTAKDGSDSTVEFPLAAGQEIDSFTWTGGGTVALDSRGTLSQVGMLKVVPNGADIVITVTTRAITTNTASVTGTGGNTAHRFSVPSRSDGKFSNLAFTFYDRRNFAGRTVNISIPVSQFIPEANNGWSADFSSNLWRIYRNYTMTDGSNYVVYVSWVATPDGWRFVFEDVHSSAANSYGAISNIVATFV